LCQKKNNFQIVEGRYDVVVITGGCLRSQVNDKRSLAMEMFHTVVIDEVHHATGKHEFCNALESVSYFYVKANILLVRLS
jgi:hypothetical protein